MVPHLLRFQYSCSSSRSEDADLVSLFQKLHTYVQFAWHSRYGSAYAKQEGPAQSMDSANASLGNIYAAYPGRMAMS